MDGFLVNSRLRIQKNIVTYIKRSLPQPGGKLNVIVGQEIAPEDIIAIGHLPAGFRTVRLAEELNVSPKEVNKYLKQPLGKTIFKGELLAEKNAFLGMQKKIILCPDDAILDCFDAEKGILKMKLLPKQVKLVSGVYGIVEEINAKSSSVTIKTAISTVYGITGSGEERGGTLRILGQKNLLLSSKQIETDQEGQIIVGGSLIFPDAFKKAIRQKVAGIISGGINANDYKSMVGGGWNILQKHWTDIGLSFMVTEGFGAISIGDDIFSLLKEHENKFAIIDGNLSRLILPSSGPDSIIYIRKTVLPKKWVMESKPELDKIPLKIGAKVRLISMPYLGYQGTVEAIDRTATLLPSGLSAVLLTVITEKEKIRIPYQNVEIIG